MRNDLYPFSSKEMKVYLQQFDLLSKSELEIKGKSINSSFPVICDDAIRFALEVLLKRLQPGVISDRRKEVQRLLFTAAPTGSVKVNISLISIFLNLYLYLYNYSMLIIFTILYVYE